MKADNRPEFQRMIRMCELRQIDLILAKSVSRFARNVKEALNYTRKLKLLGVGVQFEEEGINTLAMADEMLLNTFAAIAQEESESISQNQRLSIVKRMEAGEYIASKAPYGYRLINKKLEAFKPEAESSALCCLRVLSFEDRKNMFGGYKCSLRRSDLRPEHFVGPVKIYVQKCLLLTTAKRSTRFILSR